MFPVRHVWLLRALRAVGLRGAAWRLYWVTSVRPFLKHVRGAR